MTLKEKAKKYDEIAAYLWDHLQRDSNFARSAEAIITRFHILDSDNSDIFDWYEKKLKN